MKVLVFCTFDYWKQEHVWIAKQIYNDLKQKNYQAEIVLLPIQNSFKNYFKQIFAIRSLTIDQYDKVITLGPFAHIIKHREKIVFLTGHLNEYYELWNNSFGELESDVSRRVKDKVLKIDKLTLYEAKKVFSFYCKLNDRGYGITISKCNFPKIEFKNKLDQKDQNQRLTVLAIGSFSSRFQFDLLFKGFALSENPNLDLILMGNVERIDIYDSLKRQGSELIKNGQLRLVTDTSETAITNLISQSSLVVDTAVEVDTLSKSVYEAIRNRKPLFAFPNCGAFYEDNFF